MWFATHDGLNKFDGYSFKIYKPNSANPNSISSNLIYRITGDENDNLWVATTGGGLNYFDKSNETFTSYRHQPENANSLTSDHITSMLYDSQNRLWVGTSSGLNLVLRDHNTGKVSVQRVDIGAKNTNFNVYSISMLYEDRDGNIWIGSYTGLYQITKTEGGDYQIFNRNDEFNLPAIDVRSINEGSHDYLYIGTADGIYQITKSSSGQRQTERITEGYVSDLMIDNWNRLWAGTNKGVLVVTKKESSEKRSSQLFTYDPRDPSSLSKNIVTSLYKDSTGIIWVGTNGGGVNKYDPNRKQFKNIKRTTEPGSLSYDKIRSIYQDSNGTLWVGTEGGGLNMLLDKFNQSDYNDFKVFESILKTFAITEAKINGTDYLLVGAEGTPSLFKIDISNPRTSRLKTLRITVFHLSIKLSTIFLNVI